MTGEMMIGTCMVCRQEKKHLARKYYYYGIQCECHSPEHFEILEHCKECSPKPPSTTKVWVQPIND